jgi:hypothetical protein
METKFKVGDRVARDETNLNFNFSSHKILHGKITKVYNDTYHSELYDVEWDDGNKSNKGYLPHGLEKETYNEFNQREVALLSLCLQFALSNIDAIEELADENIKGELEDLKMHVDWRQKPKPPLGKN